MRTRTHFCYETTDGSLIGETDAKSRKRPQEIPGGTLITVVFDDDDDHPGDTEPSMDGSFCNWRVRVIALPSSKGGTAFVGRFQEEKGVGVALSSDEDRRTTVANDQLYDPW